MSLADRVIYALEATPEQAAELRQLTGEALTAKMREVMHANGLSLIEVQRRLYSIESLWAGQQGTRKRRTGLGTVASPVGSRGRHPRVRAMSLTDRSHLVRPPRPTPIARIAPFRKTLRAIARWPALKLPSRFAGPRAVARPPGATTARRPRQKSRP